MTRALRGFRNFVVDGLWGNACYRWVPEQRQTAVLPEGLIPGVERPRIVVIVPAHKQPRALTRLFLYLKERLER